MDNVYNFDNLEQSDFEKKDSTGFFYPCFGENADRVCFAGRDLYKIYNKNATLLKENEELLKDSYIDPSSVAYYVDKEKLDSQTNLINQINYNYDTHYFPKPYTGQEELDACMRITPCDENRNPNLKCCPGNIESPPYYKDVSSTLSDQVENDMIIYQSKLRNLDLTPYQQQLNAKYLAEKKKMDEIFANKMSTLQTETTAKDLNKKFLHNLFVSFFIFLVLLVVIGVFVMIFYFAVANKN